MLVDRHGPMVRGVCRRLLASPHDADDAFQATFLVLVRKAGRLRDADRLAPWLYGVARRVATKARARDSSRRDRRPIEDADLRPTRAANHDLLDVLPIFDAELGRVPSKLRDVLVLCLLQGATAEEASSQLGCPVGTVKSRLARGREALRKRLAARGLAPSGILAAAPSAFNVPASASLTRATLAAISGPTAGIAPGLAALTRGVAPAMISRTALMSSLVAGGIALAATMTWVKPPARAEQAAPRLPDPERDKAEERRESVVHLKLIALAIHNYISSTPDSHFPPSALHGADGQPKLSWRVALLPYLGERKLYGEFNLDEPWDSPHNKPLIDRMPAVYRTPHSPAPDGRTRLRGIAGKGTMFDGTDGVRLASVTDGSANTVMVATARDPVPWTKPDELGLAEGKPLPALDDSDPDWCLTVLADGSVPYVPLKDAILLRAMLTRNGGEAFAWPAQPFRPKTATPAASPKEPAVSLEQRLRKVEEKLDKIMEKLDSPAGKKP
jgi:RNA polymerase sigma factor (sigma-70 family)